MTMQDLLSVKVRVFLYLSSLSALIFSQNYCLNVCPFIDGLRPAEVTTNLGIVFLIHIAFREVLFKIMPAPKRDISLPRHSYYLSIYSWLFAGFVALLIHFFRYPDFPFGSHVKLLSSYWILGAGVLAQLEYIVLEKVYKSIVKHEMVDTFQEKISKRVLESFLIFTLAPTITLLLTVLRYYQDGVLDSHVTFEIFFLGVLFMSVATIVALIFGKLLREDTRKILVSVGNARDNNYKSVIEVSRHDELGEISKSINDMTASIDNYINEIEALNLEMIDTQKEIVYQMGEIAETRSKETGNHVKRVANYSYLLALKYGLSEEESSLLKLASPMHDIGKVAIPDEILKKPGRLTDEEFRVMKSHASLGYAMLNHSNREILKTAAIVAYEHHEKYNGEGYPRRLKGEDIHIYGRITAIADVFDALGSERVYKKAWELDKILDLLKEERGKHFDPKLIDIFFESLDEFLEIRDRYRDIG